MSYQAVENVKQAGFDCIFTLGGDGTQKSARDFTLRGLIICLRWNNSNAFYLT